MDQRAAQELARTLVAEELPQRWQHLIGVASEASRLARAIGIDDTVVTCAAWLHDIGYVAALVDTGYHPLDGARYLRAHGWCDEVCRLVAHHSAAAQRATTRGLAERLTAEFAPIESVESDILWTADATTSPDGHHVSFDERLDEILHRRGPESIEARTKMASQDAVAAAVSRTYARVRSAQTGRTRSAEARQLNPPKVTS